MKNAWLVSWAVSMVILAVGCSKSDAGGDPAADTTYSYIYVANKADRSISVLRLDASGDQPVVTTVDTIIPATDKKPEALRLNPAGTILYVTENSDGGNQGVVRAMAIDAATGIPSTTSTVNLTNTTYFVRGIGLDREGHFIFASNYIPSTDTLLVPISLGTNGTTLAEGTAFDVTGEIMQAPSAHPTLDRIYSASYGSNELMNYTYNTVTGALTQNQNVGSGGTQPRGFAVHKGGTFGVAYHGGASSVLKVFPLDASGTLGTGATVTQARQFAANYFYHDFVFHPTLDVAYGAANGPELVAPFSVDPEAGTLAELGSSVSTGATGANPVSIAIDPTGKFAFVANNGADNLAVFLIDQTTGSLTAASTATLSVGDQPVSVVIAAGQ